MPGPECRCAPRTRDLEKEKPLAAREIGFIRQFRDMRQVTSLEGGHRIFDKKSKGFCFSQLLPNKVECRLEFEGPPTGIVSIAGHKVNHSVGHPAPRIFFRSRAKNSRQGACRHLYEAAETDPFPKPLRLQAQNSVALRVGYHRPQSQELNLMQSLIHGRRDRIFVEFDEQVVALVDAEARSIHAQGLQIL